MQMKHLLLAVLYEKRCSVLRGCQTHELFLFSLILLRCPLSILHLLTQALHIYL